MGVSREQLFAEVWAEPMTAVAVRYGVSPNFLGRVCDTLAVPRPTRGYWAKCAAGLSPERPTLPAAHGGPHQWDQGRLPTRVRLIEQRRRPGEGRGSGPRPGRHPLVAGVRELFEQTYPPGDAGHLRPRKRKLPDLFVTAGTLTRGLDLASELYLALEDRGHSVEIASDGRQRRPIVDHRRIEARESRNEYYGGGSWSPHGPTVALISGVAVGLTLFELSQQRKARYVDGRWVPLEDLLVPRGRRRMDVPDWSADHDFATGRLVLRAFSAHPRTHWIQHWPEAAAGDLVPRLKRIVVEIERAVPEIQGQIVEGERKAEEERRAWQLQSERWKREQAEERRVQALKESRSQLRAFVERWAVAKQTEGFFEDALKRTAQLSEGERDLAVARIERARAMLGGVDALAQLAAWQTPEDLGG